MTLLKNRGPLAVEGLLRFWQGVKAEAVTLLPHGFDPTSFTEASLLELATQGQHLGVDGARTTTEGWPSHPQQFLAGTHHPRWHQQRAQQGEFSRTELHGLVAQGDLAQQQMDLQRAHTHPFLQPRATSSEKGATASREFLKPEGLSQHIIGARIEERHDRLRSRASRQHHDRTMELARQPQGRCFFQEFGTHQKMRRLTLTNVKSFSGRTHRGGEMAILSQSLGQHSAQSSVGVNNENPPRMAAVIKFIRLSHKSLI